MELRSKFQKARTPTDKIGRGDGEGQVGIGPDWMEKGGLGRGRDVSCRVGTGQGWYGAWCDLVTVRNSPVPTPLMV